MGHRIDLTSTYSTTLNVKVQKLRSTHNFKDVNYNSRVFKS